MLDLKELVNDAPKREGILNQLGMKPDDREVWRTHQIVDGRWRLINQVGFGAFGKVYDAIDLTTGDQVAVKVFNERFENSGYLQELGLLFGRSHPNVVEVYSFGYNRGHKYLVYEYVAGGSLRDYIVRYRKVDTEVAVDIALQIARGLDFAHTNEIVHRDLKPENILLSRSDIPFEIKICDFGLAARCSPEDRMASSFGTTAYMAPEQFKENYDSRVDIYAIGVMLYEMLFGRRPIKGDAVSVVYAHENLEIILPEGGPQKLRDLLSKTLSKSPDDRYQSAKELSEALLELQVELDQPETGPVLVRSPRRQQPELRQRWETVIPFSGRRFSVTECGQLAFVGRGRIITVERGGKFRQIFRVKDEPEQIVENGRMQGAFGWLHGDEIHMWRPDESSVVIDLPSELEKKPLNLIFGPNQDNLLVVSTEHIYLYNEIGELKWRADISTYGMVPTACFS